MTIRGLYRWAEGEIKKQGSVNHLLNGFNEGVNEIIIFGQVPVSPIFHEFRKQHIIALSGENYHWNIRVGFSDLFQGIQSIESVFTYTFQNVVQNNQVGFPVQVFQALLPRLVTDYIIIMPALKCVLQQIQDYFVIVNKKNQPAHRGWSSH